MPRSRRLACTSAHCGATAPAGAAACDPCSLALSTVGSQTTLAPDLAAISTAAGLMPPTAAFSVMAPRTSAPGTAARTTWARSAVGT
jgi:hypothetical protein